MEVENDQSREEIKLTEQNKNNNNNSNISMVYRNEAETHNLNLFNQNPFLSKRVMSLNKYQTPQENNFNTGNTMKIPHNQNNLSNNSYKPYANNPFLINSNQNNNQQNLQINFSDNSNFNSYSNNLKINQDNKNFNENYSSEEPSDTYKQSLNKNRLTIKAVGDIFKKGNSESEDLNENIFMNNQVNQLPPQQSINNTQTNYNDIYKQPNPFLTQNLNKPTSTFINVQQQTQNPIQTNPLVNKKFESDEKTIKQLQSDNIDNNKQKPQNSRMTLNLRDQIHNRLMENNDSLDSEQENERLSQNTNQNRRFTISLQETIKALYNFDNNIDDDLDNSFERRLIIKEAILISQHLQSM